MHQNLPFDDLSEQGAADYFFFFFLGAGSSLNRMYIFHIELTLLPVL